VLKDDAESSNISLLSPVSLSYVAGAIRKSLRWIWSMRLDELPLILFCICL
jgi:hypothetical protein